MNKFFYSPTKKQSILCLCAVLFFIAIAFSPVLNAKFMHFNDYANIVSNMQIRSLSPQNIKLIFQSKLQEVYVPLTVLSWAVEYRFFKLTPFVYHLNNLLLHLGVVILIYLMARKIGLSLLASCFAGLLFGLHPAHVESVAWATERKDVLYAFLYVSALYTYMFHCEQYSVRGAKNPVKFNRFLYLTSILGVLSMLAKPMALSLPLILFLFDWFKDRKLDARSIVEKIPLMIIMGAISWLSNVPFMLNRWESVEEGILIFPWSVIFYIKQFIMPLVLMPIYRVPQPVNWANTEYLFSFTVFIVIIGAFIYFRRYKWFVFAVLYYLFSIFFLLRVTAESQINLVADRFMYLPTLGICLLLSYAFDRLINRGRASNNQFLKFLPVICLVVLFGLLGIKTYHQASIWKNDETLWEHQLKNNPQEYVALTHLATSLMDRRDYQNAIKRHRKIRALQIPLEEIKDVEELNDMFKKVDYIESLFKRSIKINPKQPESHYNLGYFYELLGVADKALMYYSIAASLNPEYSDLYLRIGFANLILNQDEKAVASFEKLLSFNPDANNYVKVILAYKNFLNANPDNVVYANALKSTLARYVDLVNSGAIDANGFYNLGLIYETLGMYEDALRSYKMVSDKNVQNIEAYYHSGLILKNMNRLSEALGMFDKALKIDGRRVDILLEKAEILYALRKSEEALKVYESLLKIDPNHPEGLIVAAYVHEQLGYLVKAIKLYERAIKVSPDNPEAFFNLGNIYNTVGSFSSAKKVYLKATQLRPAYGDAWINLTLLTFNEGNIAEAYEYYKQAQLYGYEAPEAMLNAFQELKKISP